MQELVIKTIKNISINEKINNNDKDFEIFKNISLKYQVEINKGNKDKSGINIDKKIAYIEVYIKNQEFIKI